MSLEDDIRILSGVALFEELSNEQLRLLAFGAERIALTEGRELFREGDKADSGYIVVSGIIDLVRDTASGRRVLKKVVPPMVLGELALITETTRMTGAVAAEGSQVCNGTIGALITKATRKPTISHRAVLVAIDWPARSVSWQCRSPVTSAIQIRCARRSPGLPRVFPKSTLSSTMPR